MQDRSSISSRLACHFCAIFSWGCLPFAAARRCMPSCRSSQLSPRAKSPPPRPDRRLDICIIYIYIYIWCSMYIYIYRYPLQTVYILASSCVVYIFGAGGSHLSFIQASLLRGNQVQGLALLCSGNLGRVFWVTQHGEVKGQTKEENTQANKICFVACWDNS